MTTSTYYLVPNSAGTAFMGTGYTPDGTLPSGVIPCTQAQAQAFQSYMPDMSTTPPSIVDAPASVLLTAAQTAQTALLKQSRNTAIESIPVTINGTAYTIDNSPAQQAANLNLAMSMQVIVAQVPAWSTGESVAAGAYCNLGGVYLYCSTGGTTGTTAPTAPTAFGIPVTDGTAAWELLGRHVWLTDGAAILLTPQEAMAGATQIEAYMSQQTFKLTGLLAQVAAATTVTGVQAVVW